MKFLTSKNDLQKSVGRIVGVINSHTSLPVLSNILFDTRAKDSIQLTGTDLEVGVTTVLVAEVEKEGSVTIPAKKLHDILRELPDTAVTVTVSKNYNITLEAGKAHFKIVGMPKDDFPKLPAFNKEDGFEMEQKMLKECLGLTAFSVSHDQTRYILSGTLFNVKNKEIRLITTDGRRLSFVKRTLPDIPKQELDVVVPLKTTNELNKQLGDTGVLNIVPLHNQIAFDLGETQLISRLIEGKFPNYEQVIPKEEKSLISIDREALLSAVRRAALLTSPDAQAIKMDILENKILVSSRSPNLGEAQEELSAKLKGKEIAIGFNPQYLIDVLKSLNDDEVFLSLSDPDKSGMVKGSSNDFLYVVMPMQLT